MTKVRQVEVPLNPRKFLRICVVSALVLLAVYVYFDVSSYVNAGWLKAPPQPWADNVIDCLIILAAIPAPGFGLLLTRQFTSSEPQRRIWLFFAIGWFCWVLGEVTGFVYSQIYATLPDITLTDLFWVAGYIFFGIAIYYQYVLIYVRGNIYGGVRSARMGFVSAVLHTLLLPFIIAVILRQAGFNDQSTFMSTYLNVLYPTCDLVVGIAALWFSLIFRRGVLGRPWLGLLLFAVSDGISGWYWLGGQRLLTPGTDTALSVMTDLLYIGGYLFTALACLSIYLVTRYGTGWQSRPEPPDRQVP